jgi:hypothetical protein
MGTRKRKDSGRDRHFIARRNEAKQNSEKYRQAQLSNKDAKDAKNGLKEYTGHQAKMIYGGLIGMLKDGIETLKEVQGFSKKEITRVETKISKTEEHNRTATQKENKTPFKEWEGKDLGVYWSYWVILVLTVGGGGACLYAYATTLIPAYINNPQMALFLVTLPIATTIATKQLYEDRETDKGKKRVSSFVSAFSLLSFINWLVVLGLMLIGGMGGDDLDQLESPDYLDGIFVVSQVIAEVFVSGSIYIALSKIYTKYNPDTYKDNEQLIQLKASLTELRNKDKALVEEIAEKQKELIQLEAEQASFICEEVVMFQAQRARMEAGAPDLGISQKLMEVKMKKYIVIVAIIFGVLIFAGTKAFGRDLVVGLSPHMTAQKADVQVKEISGFLLDTLQPGDSAMVFNAYTNESISTFTVPNRSAYKHRKVKIKALKKAILKLRRFGKQASNSGVTNDSTQAGTILWPQFLRFVGEYFPASKPTDIFLLGSPLYPGANPNDKTFSMLEGAVPGDGHLLVTRARSPFGAAKSEQLLNNFRVHFGIPDASWKKNDQHGHFVQRFITLFTEKLGGKLISFTHDLPTVFRRLEEHAPAPTTQYAVVPNDKLEMISFVYQDIPAKEVSIDAPQVETQASENEHVETPVPTTEVSTIGIPIHERPISTEIVSTQTAKKAKEVEVGLSWVCPKQHCDYDIHAQAFPGTRVLNFSNKSTDEGTHLKDFTSSPKLAENAYETIVFKVPVDLSRLKLAVNFYGGKVPRPNQIELRIAIQDRTYMRRYEVFALKGNKGKGFKETFESGTPANQNWIVIDPMQVVGLR